MRMVRGDTSAKTMVQFDEKIRQSWIAEEMRPVRSVHQSFRYGLFAGIAFSGLSLLTRGWWIRDPIPSVPGHERMKKSIPAHPLHPDTLKPDRKLTSTS